MSGDAILAILADGIGYHGALVAVDGGGPAVLAEAATGAIGLAAALADLAARLPPPAGRRLGGAVLLSWQVQAAVLALPVDPRRPRPAAQMRELVRWELEPLAASARSRRLGAILVGRGHLRAGDRDRLLADLESPFAGGPAPRRLGEAAVESGLVTPAQLAECLSLQQQARDPEGTLVCGWRPLRRRAGDGRWRWLAAGAPESLVAEARAAAAAAGLGLLAVLPAAGCARPPGDAIQVVLDHQRGLLCRMRWEDGEPVDVRQTLLPADDDPLAATGTAVDADVERLWLVGDWPPDVRARLAVGARPVAPLPAGPLAGLAWAAQAAVDAGLPVAAVRLAGGGAGWWRDRLALAIAGCAATAAAAGLAGILLLRQADELGRRRQAELRRSEEARDERARQAAAARPADPGAGPAAEVLRRRGAAVRALDAIAEACPDGVRAVRILVAGAGRVEVEGRAATPAGAQAFRNGLIARLPGLAPAEPALALRQEVDGFAFSVRLVGDR